MPDPFFASTKSRKRKRTDSRTANSYPSVKGRATPSKKPRGKRKVVDEELSDQTNDDEGVEDLDLERDGGTDAGASGEEDDDETPAEKRLRLAKLYLESVKDDLAEGEYDAAEIDKEIINARLKQDVLEHSGKVHLFIADFYDFSHALHPTLRTRGHRLSVTASFASESCRYLFTSGKEGSIIRWDLSTGRALNTFHKVRPTSHAKNGKGKNKETTIAEGVAEIKGHIDEVLTLAVSSDGKYLVSAGRDKRIGVWNAEKGEWIRSFGGSMGHKDSISALAFRKGTHQLYSGSLDRTIKVYDLSPNVMGYVETLFGHQDHVTGVDALRAETCVSVGAHDKTARFWKIVDETQLVFRGGGRSRIREILEGGLRGDDEGDVLEGEDEMVVDGIQRQKRTLKDPTKFVEGSLDCIAMVDENTFITGGDSGSLCLWTTQKKKPIFTQPLAHGLNEMRSAAAGLVQKPRWITALGCLRYSDLFASGSWDGSIRLWKLDAKLKSFSPVGTIAVPGVVNSLQLLVAPKEFCRTARWVSASNDMHALKEVRRSEGKDVPSVLMIAGVGQEHRLGRWIKIGKEGGGRNGAYGGGYGGPPPGYGGHPQPSGYGGGFTSGVHAPAPPPGADPQLWNYFTSVDQDRSGAITAQELERALVNGDWSPFDLDTVKLLMSIFDTDRSGTIGFNEFVGLWKYIKDWQNVFAHFDRDRSGTIDGNELRNALTQFGYSLSPPLLTLLQKKYASEVKPYSHGQAGITFDRFVRACVVVKQLSDSFRRLDTDQDGWIQISYDQFMHTVLSLP
ncbi:hypothetical protein AX17_006359 [Amanita inopinata Kibby_2008]|nr:hypothetical protein AX17_006359 [Amanita inopinata Kibby_2008]